MDVDALIGIIIWILIIGWSAIGARLAFKKGYRTLGISIIATTIIFIGSMLAILAFVRPYKLEEKELRIQCPKCNASRGTELKTVIDQRTMKPATILPQAILWGLLAVIFFGGGLFMAILFWTQGDSKVLKYTLGPTLGPILAGIGFLVFGSAIGQYGIKGVINYLKADRKNATLYTCIHCKNEWMISDS